MSRADVAGMTSEDVQRLVQELQVHQIELELQNQELRDAQLRLAESRDRYSDLFEFAPVGYLSLGGDGVIREANLTASGMLARERVLLVGQKLSNFISADSQDTLYLRWRAALESETRTTCELRLRLPDGTGLDVLAEILPHDTAASATREQAAVEVRVTLTDISERKQAEGALRQLTDSLERQVAERTESLRERERWLSAILNTTADAIITTDRRGIIVNANRTTEKIFGYADNELIGQNVNMLIQASYSAAHDEYLQNYLHMGQSRIIGGGREIVARRKDGSVFPADLAVSEVEHLRLFTGILRDISERKELQEHVLAIADEEQRRLGQELHDGICQELTSLALISASLVEFMGRATPSEDAGQATWRMDDAGYSRLRQVALRLAEGLQQTNHHVRDLSRGIMPVQIEAQGLHSALAELAATTSMDENIICRFESSGDVPVGDSATATHLYRIAQEALSNSLRHGPATRICISLARNASHTILEVADDGVGFDPDALRQSTPAGRGMGLRTMEYRAGMIGGALHVERQPEGGTIVRCRVPHARERDKERRIGRS